MPIIELDKDPRTEEQKRTDDEIRELAEKGELVPPEKRREAIERIKAKREAARAKAAELGTALGHVRDYLGITQEALALAIGSNKTYISKLESGRQGGVSMEIVLAICHALGELGGKNEQTEAVIMSQLQSAVHGL